MVEAVVEFDYKAREADELTIRKGDVITNIKRQTGGWWEGILKGKRGMFPDNFVKVLSVESETNSHSMEEKNGVTLRIGSKRQYKALFSYKPENGDELELQADDVIDFISEVEEGWWKGKLRDRVGVFPSNFVTEAIPNEDAQSDENNRKEAAHVNSEEQNSITSPEKSTTASPDKSNVSGNEINDDIDAPTLPPKPDSGTCSPPPRSYAGRAKKVKELCRALYPYDAENEDELSLKEGDVITIVTREVQDKGWWKGEVNGRIGVFPDNFVEIIQVDEHPKKPERPPVKSSHLLKNVIKDNIKDNTTKPVSKIETNITNVPNALQKKLINEVQPKDEKPLGPPVPVKKPHLPPPMKKPQRPIPGHTTGQLPVHLKRLSGEIESQFSKMEDNVDSTKSPVDKTPGNSSEMDFDSVERSAILTHPTATRVKAPKRRPPSTVFNKESEFSGLMNGNVEPVIKELDIKEEEEGKVKLREVDKKGTTKLPWMEELKLNQAKRSSKNPDADDSEEKVERKVPVVPRPSSLRPDEIPSLPAKRTPRKPPRRDRGSSDQIEEAEEIRSKPRTTNITPNAGTAPVAGQRTTYAKVAPVIPQQTSASTAPSTTQETMDAPVSSVRASLITPMHPPSAQSAPRLHSQVQLRNSGGISGQQGTRPVSVPSPSSNTTTSSSDKQVEQLPELGGGSSGIVTIEMYNDLLQKFQVLKQDMENQKETLQTVIKMLNEEKERRLTMEHDLERLRDLMTQV